MSHESSSAEAAPILSGIALRPQPLSRGPLAVIYRGWDRAHRCEVVVKVQRATDDPVALNRFEREAAVMERLRHPGIVTLYVYHKDNPAALVMEYIPGPTLAALVAAEGRLSPARTAKIIEEVAAALDCVHAFGIVHRDVKPSNILLPRRGSAKLTDFGVARIDDDVPLTVMGDILGTIEYASPEQVHGNGAVDARSDVYSLAAVAYFALAGTPPFRAADSSTQAQLSVMHRQVFAAPPPLRLHRSDLTPAIEEAVLRGLAKAPEARYDSAGQFAAALRAAVLAASGEPQQSVAAASRRTEALAGALGAAVLLLAGFGLWRTALYRPSAPQAVASVTPAPPAFILPKPAPVASAKPAVMVPHPAHALPVIAAASVGLKAVSVKPMPAAYSVAIKPPHKTVLVAHAPKPKLPVALPRKTLLAAVPQRRPPAVFVSPPAPPVAMSDMQPHFAVYQTAVKTAAAKQGWLRVYATQNTAGFGQPEKMASISAKTITVDGHSMPALTAGHWLALPAGRHWVSFYPGPRSEFGPRVHIPVTIAAGAHIGHQVLLAVATGSASRPAEATHLASLTTPPHTSAGVGWYTVSGWIALTEQATAEKAALIPAAPLWVKVDGHPLPPLAEGRWAVLPAGKHQITFQPAPGLGVGPKTWAIDIAPSVHLSQQVPLPSVPLPDIPTHLRNP